MLLFAIVSLALAGEPVQIIQLSVKSSNAYLIKSTPPVLIDAGGKGGDEKLVDGLKENGVDLKDLALVIFTHGHHDHAGLGSWLKAQGVRTAIGQGDLALATSGHNDELKPTRFSARLIGLFIPSSYPAFTPDETISAERAFDWGKVLPMPGHTAGSLIALLNDGKDAIVGDQMLGGALGGALWSDCPGEHYFHADENANRENIRKLLAQGVERFHLGHGGPVVAADVAKEFAAP